MKSPNDPRRAQTNSTPQDHSAEDMSKGFELDEDRPYGQNSGWARQGEQVDGKPSRTDEEEIEPTHQDRTDSTTNTQ